MQPDRLVERIKDILEAISKIQRYVVDDPGLSEPITVEAVSYNLAVIGEAIKAIPKDVRDLAPAADWSPAAKMRDVLIHHYAGVDRSIVAATVENDLPVLKAAAEVVLRQLEQRGR